MGRIIDRRRVMGGKNLPYDAEIEYLESSGIQWIDTGFYPNQDTRVIVETKITTTNQPHNVIYIFDAKINWGNKAYTVGSYSGTPPGVAISYNNKSMPSQNIVSYNTNRMIVDFNKNSVTVGNIYSYSFNYAMFGCSRTLKFFSDATGSLGCSIMIYSAKIFDSDVLTLELIPVRVGQVGYMYDKVSKQLFGNSGTGAFILGPDK